MTLDIHYDELQNIVIAVPEAEINTMNIVLTIQESLSIAKKHNCTNILVDMRKCKIGQSISQAFMDMSDLEKTTGLGLKYKLAAIYDVNTYPIDRAEFIESVVSNRPNPNLRMFQNEVDAVKWLKGKG